MRIIIFLFILLLLDLYVFQAVKVLSAEKTELVKQIWRGSYWATSIIAFLIMYWASQTTGTPEAGKLLTYVRAGLFIFYLSKFVIILFLFLDDIRRLAKYFYGLVSSQSGLDLSRSDLMVQTALIAGLLPFSTLIYGMIRNPYRYQIIKQTINLEQLTEKSDLKIVHISDIHSGSFNDPEAVLKGVQKINALQADLVFFTGDIVNNRADELLPYIPIFSQIESRLGVYSVLGNHDYGDYVPWQSIEAKRANLDSLIAYQKRMGWKLLLDEHVILNHEGVQIAIAGIQNSSGSLNFKSYGNLQKALEGTSAVELRLLLSHDPSFWDSTILKHQDEIHVTFSGHTHGFQFGVEIPGWFKWSPVQYIYKQWAGVYENNSKYLYVNRGFGFLGYPGRLGILPEITEITLSGKEGMLQ